MYLGIDVSIFTMGDFVRSRGDFDVGLVFLKLSSF